MLAFLWNSPDNLKTADYFNVIFFAFITTTCTIEVTQSRRDQLGRTN